MTTEQRNTIVKIQKTLIAIDNGQKIFFNVTQYENLGLVVSRKKWGTDSRGNKTELGHTFHLTAKAKQYIKIAI